ncbi:hypothetical protein ACFL6I_13790 [candidate division KSB1 bacterium]
MTSPSSMYQKNARAFGSIIEYLPYFRKWLRNQKDFKWHTAEDESNVKRLIGFASDFRGSYISFYGQEPVGARQLINRLKQISDSWEGKSSIEHADFKSSDLANGVDDMIKLCKDAIDESINLDTTTNQIIKGFIRFLINQNIRKKDIWGDLKAMSNKFYSRFYVGDLDTYREIPELKLLGPKGHSNLSVQDYDGIVRDVKRIFKDLVRRLYHGKDVDLDKISLTKESLSKSWLYFDIINFVAIKNPSFFERVYVNIMPKHIHEVIFEIINFSMDFMHKNKISFNTDKINLSGKISADYYNAQRPDTIVLYLKGNDSFIFEEFKRKLVQLINSFPGDYSNDYWNIFSKKVGLVSLAPEPSKKMMDQMYKIGWRFYCEHTSLKPGERCPKCRHKPAASFGGYVSWAVSYAVLQVFGSIDRFIPFDEKIFDKEVRNNIDKIREILVHEFSLE